VIKRLLVVAFLVVSHTANADIWSAQNQCNTLGAGQTGFFPGTYLSSADAGTAVVAACNSIGLSNCGYDGVTSSTIINSGTQEQLILQGSWNSGSNTFSCGIVRTLGDTDCGEGYSYTADDGSGYAGCEESGPECTGELNGLREQLPWQLGANIPSQGLCDTATGCNAVPVGDPFCHADTPSGTTTCTLTVEHTDQTCTLPTDVDLSNNPDNTPQCASIGGATLCQSPDDPNADADGNCGYVNGEYLCLGGIPDGTCVFTSDGGMACSSNATSPPAPDDGTTAGTPAPPDIQVSNNDSNTVNIYGASSVAGSIGNPTGTGGGADGTSGGAGTAENDPGSDTGTGTASGGCSAPPVCTGGDPQICALLLQQWHTQCPDIPSGADVLSQSGLDGETVDTLETDGGDLSAELDDSGFLSTRSCALSQTVDLGYFGVHTFDFDVWCPLFAFIGYLVLASGWIASVRIVAGAF